MQVNSLNTGAERKRQSGSGLEDHTVGKEMHAMSFDAISETGGTIGDIPSRDKMVGAARA